MSTRGGIIWKKKIWQVVLLQNLEDFTYLIMQEADSQDKIEKVRKTARKISEF